jgi:hypothetical protein
LIVLHDCAESLLLVKHLFFQVSKVDILHSWQGTRNFYHTLTIVSGLLMGLILV